MRRVYLLTLVGLFWALAAPQATAQQRDRDWRVCAQANEDPEGAFRACTAILGRGNRESQLRRAIAYSNRCEAHNRLQRHEAALADCTEAIRLNPRYANAFRNSGLAYEQRGNLEAARDDFRQAGSLGHQQAQADLVRVEERMAVAQQGDRDREVCAQTTQDPEGAVTACTAILGRGSQESRFRRAIAYSNRCEAHNRLQRHEAALADCTEAIRLNPRYANAFSNRGFVHQRRGDFEAARADFQQAANLGHPEAQANVAELVRRMAAARPAPAPAVPTVSVDAVDLAMWQSVQGSGNVADFEEYLRQFPQGRFVGLAQNRITSLRAPVATAVAGQAPTAQTVATPVPAALPPERRVALVIGNGRYAHATRLANAGHDAEAMAASLRGLGFEVTHLQDLGNAAMRRALLDFGEAARGADLAVFFYAGHGVQMGLRDRAENYLVPVDARLADARGLEDETVRLGRVLDLMEEARARIVILDACRDNPVALRMANVAGTRSVSRGLAPLETDSGGGTLVAFATAPGTVAADGTGQNSPFTAALLRHLPTQGVEFRSVLTRVRAEVAEATRHTQVPWSNDGLLREVYLAGRN